MYFANRGASALKYSTQGRAACQLNLDKTSTQVPDFQSPLASPSQRQLEAPTKTMTRNLASIVGDGLILAVSALPLGKIVQSVTESGTLPKSVRLLKVVM